MTGMSRAQFTGTVVTVAVTAAVVAGIYVLGSPLDERARRLDERRVEDLSGISQAIDVYWTRQSSLPASLDRLRPETGANVTVADPVTGAPYEYMVLDARRYRLCAKFDTDSATTDGEPGRYEFAGVSPEWQHPAGRYCFDRLVERAD